MRNYFLPFISCLILGGLNGCSSAKKSIAEVDNSDTIKRDYEVRDASTNIRPGWMSDPMLWAESNTKDTDKYRYFSLFLKLGPCK